MPKRHGNLWQKITTMDNMWEAYKKARRLKSHFMAVKKFEKNEEYNLRVIRRSLLNKTFTTSKYQEKIVYEPKKRVIYVLPFSPDRIVQHALMNFVEPIWDKLLTSHTHACRVGKGIRTGSDETMKHVRKYDYCLKCDISSFYPSVDQNILYEQVVQRKIKCPDTLWLLQNIIFSYPGGRNVPIGNYTSQWFGNLYMDIVDRWATEVVKVEGYSRYCDDFCFYSNDKKLLLAVQQELPTFLWEQRRLTLSRSDLFQTARGVDYLGYRHFGDFKLIRKKTARRIKKRLLKIYDEIKAGADPMQYQSHIASAYGWLRNANGYNFSLSLHMPYLMKKAGIHL